MREILGHPFSNLDVEYKEELQRCGCGYGKDFFCFHSVILNLGLSDEL